MTEEELRLAKERLMKLWDAYEALEGELRTASYKVKDLEEKQKDKERVIETLRELTESKDQELRKIEVQRAASDRELLDLKNRLDESVRSLEIERGRYKKLYILTQELEREVERLGKELDERDRWFRENISFLEEFPNRVGKRLSMLEAKGGRASTIDELAPEPSPAPPPPAASAAGTTFQKLDPMEEGINELRSIPGVDDARAKTLYKAGYVSKEKLKQASPFELLKLEGMTPTLARKITDHVKQAA